MRDAAFLWFGSLICTFDRSRFRVGVTQRRKERVIVQQSRARAQDNLHINQMSKLREDKFLKWPFSFIFSFSDSISAIMGSTLLRCRFRYSCR